MSGKPEQFTELRERLVRAAPPGHGDASSPPFVQTPQSSGGVVDKKPTVAISTFVVNAMPLNVEACREETAALLAIIKAGHNRVTLCIRQSRTLLSNDAGRSATAFLVKSLPRDPSKPLGLSRKSRLPETVRLLIEEISSGKFFTLNGKWSDNWSEAKEFSSVLGLLHFALEHLLAFPLGVFCAFQNREDDFSIALCSVDFFQARQWDLQINQICLSANGGKAWATVISVNDTDQIHALRYLPR